MRISILIIIALALLFLCALTYMCYGYITVDQLIRIGEALVSWPTAILIIVLVFMSRFKGAIDFFLKNRFDLTTPWGRLKTQPAGLTSSEGTEHEGATKLSKADAKLLSTVIAKVVEQRNSAQRDIEGWKKAVNDAHMTAYGWKFTYLNLFFIDTTKRVLLWFARNPTETKDTYHEAWQQFIPDKDQREIIFQALWENRMLQGNTILSITTEGTVFLQHIGWLENPPPPAPAPAPAAPTS